MFFKESVQTGIGLFNMLERIEPKMISQSPLCLNENVKSISNCKNKKETICCTLLKKTQTLQVLSKVTILLYNMKTSTYYHFFSVTKTLLAYTLEIIIKEKLSLKRTLKNPEEYIYMQTIPSRVNILF